MSQICRPVIGDGVNVASRLEGMNNGQRARLIELDPKYVDVIVQRWQEATGG